MEGAAGGFRTGHCVHVHSEEPDLEEIFCEVTGREFGVKKHLRVLRTLFVKDIVDMFKIPTSSTIAGAAADLYRYISFVDLGMSPAYLLMLGVMMNLCLTPLSVLGAVIAEGREKNTNTHADAVQS